MTRHSCVTRPRSLKNTEEEQMKLIALNYFGLEEQQVNYLISKDKLFYEVNDNAIHITMVHEDEL